MPPPNAPPVEIFGLYLFINAAVASPPQWLYLTAAVAAEAYLVRQAKHSNMLFT